MNALTGELAADIAFEWASVPSIPVALICAYNGAALPTKAHVDGWARATLLGFESSTTRSYAGYDAGVADAEFTANVFDAWGYPKECGYWVCAADTPSTDPVFVPNITEYHRGFCTRMRQRGYVGPATKYGNPRAVEAACAGAWAAGTIGLRWGVGTWGYGEGGAPNSPPTFADVELLQSGNTPGPVPGVTDLDWLYVPINVFAAYNGPSAPAPNLPPPLEDPMLLIIVPTPFGGHLARLTFSDGVMVDDAQWTSSGEADEIFGVPKAAADALGPQLGGAKRQDFTGKVAADVIAGSDAATARAKATPSGDGGGGAATPIDYDQLGAAVARHLSVTVQAV